MGVSVQIRSGEGGFTLVEILVAVAILAILSKASAIVGREPFPSRAK